MNNAAHDELEELLPIVESFEFPYCDMAHEDVKRSSEGTPLSDEYIPECPAGIQEKRPACAHCHKHWINEEDGIEEDILLKLSNVLLSAYPSNIQLKILNAEHEQKMEMIQRLDVAIREARTGSQGQLGNGPIPSAEEAKKRAAPLVAEHRAIVDRMRHFRDTLVTMAKELL